MKIVNLTQHVATPEQQAAGVFEPADKAAVQKLLTFDSMPSWHERVQRGIALAEIARLSGAEAAMIGGASYLMAPLENALLDRGLLALHSFTKRDRHVGWIGLDG